MNGMGELGMTETDGASVQSDGSLPVFPFFVGCGRSGTTLVREIFRAHPELAIPPESHFLSRMVQRERKGDGPVGFSAERFLSELLGGPWLSRWGLSKDAVSKAVLDPPPSGLADAVRRVFALYARLSGKPRYGDKTPRYVLHITQLANLFPEARFVHIIRDGRDVTMSQMEKSWGANNAVEGALIWTERVMAGRQAGRMLGPTRYHEIQYERLLDDPEGAARSLCEFIDVQFDPTMLRYYEQRRVARPARERRTGKRMGRLHLPPTKGLRDWRRQMSKGDIAAFESIGGDLLQDLGYERGIERLPAWRRLLVRARVFTSRNIFAARRLARRARGKARVRPRTRAAG
jgi:hypothetical protein